MKKPFALIATAALALSACTKEKPNMAPPVAEVGVVTLTTQSLALKTELAGRTSASLTSDVRPQVTGIIKARKFEEGAQVQAGQVLYLIDPSSYQAAFDQAKAALVNAEAAVSAAKLKDARYTDLLSIEGVSKQDADDAHTAYQQALAAVAQQKAAVESARINLDYTQVRAPIGGRIGISSVTPGALVTATQTTALATIRTLNPIYVDLTQSSADLLRMRRMLASEGIKAGNAEVSLILEDGSNYALKGRLKFAEVAVDAATGSVTLRAEFPNPNGQLLPGMYVKAVLDEAVDSTALLAPQQGITHDPKGQASALVVTPDNRVEQRTVVTQRALDDQWLVSSGLSKGDRLIVQGSNKVRPGATVKVVEVQQAASAASTPASASSAAQER